MKNNLALNNSDTINNPLKIVEDLEEETSYDKGRMLENEFSVFMKHELGWDKVRVGAHMSGKENVKGAAIDIIGERLDAKGSRYYKYSIIAIIAAALCLVYAVIWMVEEIDNGGTLLLIYSFIGMGLSIIFLIYSSKNNKENAWVECKNLKGKVNINHIDKSIREYNDYIMSRNKEYKFKYMYFVSANGFV